MNSVSGKFLMVGLGTGIAAGILAGLVGIAGGVLIVPALVYFVGFNQKLAQGTSLAVLLPPSGALAFYQYYRTGNVDLRMAALIFLGLMLGGWLGGSWAQHLSNEALRKGFAVFLVLTGFNMWFTTYPVMPVTFYGAYDCVGWFSTFGEMKWKTSG
jgi:uncharacterized membrane protein YfcA